MLQQAFGTISLKYSNKREMIDSYWQEIEQAHQGRAYHNLGHLHAIYQELQTIKHSIHNYDALFYATCYHDFIYDIHRDDNEYQSALLSKERLTSLLLPSDIIEAVYEHIIATKTHTLSLNSDSNLFMDADLAILASEHYLKYTQAIRQEYKHYSDKEFYQGRRMVLKHFLAQERIYHSEYFYDKYEITARNNLKQELASLIQSVL